MSTKEGKETRKLGIYSTRSKKKKKKKKEKKKKKKKEKYKKFSIIWRLKSGIKVTSKK